MWFFYRKMMLKPLNNSNVLPKLGIKANNFSAYGLLISLLGLILMKLGRGKVANE